MTTTEEPTKSLTEKVVDLFASRQIGEVVSYEDLRAIGCDIQKRRTTVLKAIDRHLKSRQLACACIPRQGYQITHPDEAPRLVKRRLHKATRQIGKGRLLTENVDRKLMSQPVRQQMDALNISIQALQKEMREVQRKQAFHSRLLEKHDRAIEGLQDGVLGRLGPDAAEVLEQMIQEYRKGKE